LPTISEVAVIKVTGAELFAALENGVSRVPKLEGRFPQVRFDYSSSHPTMYDITSCPGIVVRDPSNRQS